MQGNLDALTTERSNKNTLDLSYLSTIEMVKRMNAEDKKVAFAVENVLPQVAEAIDVIAHALANGGHLYYFGAGTSGRLGILDASECPPTFGTPPDLVKGMIAGGQDAISNAVEGAEDNAELGKADVDSCQIDHNDVVVGIAASGRTPYVIAALKEARLRGAKTISLTCNQFSDMNQHADVAINVVVGPEVVTGSTRLKAGTAQKMVLNMLTTCTMVRLGKVYGNLMVNLKATNGKLRERVKRIIMDATNVDYQQAQALADAAGGDARIAILMHQYHIGHDQAAEALRSEHDHFLKAIDRLENELKSR
ncbi:N-acetylmuramic acid 6-phosphate etherase [Camelliibacillus cellulosilyticus]|uniref:N-acetylmuramic acid 6-phosphate etherase n=1 Tax=Camelliibacillus cellulosilyticus TaxID=2174486 RepID=A0ABV9GST3_9BACL